MYTIQQRRERDNRQINERLRTLIAAYVFDDQNAQAGFLELFKSAPSNRVAVER